MGFAGVHRHSRLAQHVLARSEGCHGQRAVHVGPGADANGVQAFVLQQLFPIVVNGRDIEGVGDTLSRLPAAVGHGANLDASGAMEPGNVPVAGVSSGSNQADSDGFDGHGVTSGAG